MPNRRRPLLLAAAAVWTAAVMAAAVAGETGLASSTGPVAAADGDGEDIQLYRSVVDRVRGGEYYYAVLAEELPRRKFASSSTFNYRVPAYAYTLAVLGDRGGQAVLGTIGVLGTALTGLALARRYTVWEGFAFAVLQLGVLTGAAGSAGVYFAEAWAGELILLSLGLTGAGRPKLGAAAGILALAFRELAAPFVVVAALVALRDRRRGEILVWAGGLFCYAGLYAWHYAQVQQYKPADGLVAPSWLAFGGLPFVLTTCRMNGYLAGAPGWAVGLFLSAAGIGFCRGGSRPAVPSGLAGGSYIVAFCIAGLPFHYYWGAVVAPLMPVGVVLAPSAVRALLAGRPAPPLPNPLPRSGGEGARHPT